MGDMYWDLKDIQKEKFMSNSPFKFFMILLTVLFIAMKLAGYIDWAWYLVLLPVSISFLITILAIIIWILIRIKEINDLRR